MGTSRSLWGQPISPKKTQKELPKTTNGKSDEWFRLRCRRKSRSQSGDIHLREFIHPISGGFAGVTIFLQHKSGMLEPFKQ